MLREGNKEPQNHTVGCLNVFMCFCADHSRGGGQTAGRASAGAGGRAVLSRWHRASAAWGFLATVPSGSDVGHRGPAAQLLWVCVPLHLSGCRHSPVPDPWGPAAVITPACAVPVPLGSSSRGLLTSGSPVEEAEVVVVAAAGTAVAVAVAAAEAAAAGSSDPTSHTRVTTTGVDELAWAARSCRGLVRAGGRGKETWVGKLVGTDADGPDTGARSPVALVPRATAAGSPGGASAHQLPPQPAFLSGDGLL